MSFFEVETWQPQLGKEAEHDEIIRRWSMFVRENKPLFKEWRSAQYYREVQRNADQWTGRYVMAFEYENYEGYRAYKERRKGFQGPYAAYGEVDPYPYFEPESVVVSHWQPHQQNLWKMWLPTTSDSFYDVVTWTPQEGVLADHDAMMLKWYDFVVQHHDELFAEWLGVHYYQGVDRESGALIDRYRMVFEYNNRAGFLAYKERRKDYPGPYAAYLGVDPVVYFIEETKTIFHWQPHELDQWIDFTAV
jgi:hypothetical protein